MFSAKLEFSVFFLHVDFRNFFQITFQSASAKTIQKDTRTIAWNMRQNEPSVAEFRFDAAENERLEVEILMILAILMSW